MLLPSSAIPNFLIFPKSGQCQDQLESGGACNLLSDYQTKTATL